MLQRAIAVFMASARVGAVALALSTGGYLIVTAQRRANPQHVEAAPGPVNEESAGSFGAVTPAQVDAALWFLASSKARAHEATEPGTQLEPYVFFAGSKSMPLTDTSIVGAQIDAADLASPLASQAAGAPVYLPSSKFLSPGSIVYPTTTPKPVATPGGAPGQP